MAYECKRYAQAGRIQLMVTWSTTHEKNKHQVSQVKVTRRISDKDAQWIDEIISICRLM